MSSDTALPASSTPQDGQSAGGAHAVSPLRRWSSLAILLFLSILAFIDRSIIALMVDPIKESLHLSDFQIGLLEGFAFALFYALCGIPIGRALDRNARNPIMYAGITIWSLMSAACGLAMNFFQMLIARFGVGVGEAVMSPGAYAIISNLFPRERLGTAMAIYSIGASLGAGIAMLVGSFVVAIASQEVTLPIVGVVEEWRIVFMVTGLPGVVFAFLIFFVPEFHKRAPVGQDGGLIPKGNALAFMRSRAPFLTCHFLGFSLLALMAGGVTGWLPTYLIRFHGWEPAQAGLCMAGMVLFLTLGVLGGGFIVDALIRRGVKNAHMLHHSVTTTIAFVCGSTAYFFDSVWVTLAFVGVALACTAMGGVAASSLQLVTPPSLRSQISATYLVCVSIIGTGGGPLFVATMTDFVLRDEMKVGLSLGLTYTLIAPLAFVCFFLGSRLMARAIDQAEADAAAKAN